MTSHDDLVRDLAAWLDEEAAQRAPGELHARFIDGISRSRQRPGWATTERWISMETRAQLGAVPRAAIILVTFALLAALAAGAIVVGSSSEGPSPAPFGVAANGLIAYSAGGDIHVVRPDGSGSHRLTSGPALDTSPHWSRDGRRLAYWSKSGTSSYGQPELVIIDVDSLKRLVVSRAASRWVGPFMSWSADGSEIAYSSVVPVSQDPCPTLPSDGGMCGSRIFIAGTGGAGTRQVGLPELDARSPELSPDGRTIAFGGGPSGSEALYTMDWAGRHIRRRTTAVVHGGGWGFIHQEWSSDGEHIVTQDGQPLPDIWVVEAAGREEVNLSAHPQDEIIPRIAPNDGAISWSRLDEGTMVDATSDRNDAVLVPTFIDLAIWSPDGELLAGIDRSGSRLVVVGRDGSVVAETDAPGIDAPLSWQRLAP